MNIKALKIHGSFFPCASASLRLCVKILLFKNERQRPLTQSRKGAETQGEEICFVFFAFLVAIFLPDDTVRFGI